MIDHTFTSEEDGNQPYKSRVATPIAKIECYDTPYTVPSNGIDFTVYSDNNFTTTNLSGTVPAVTGYWGNGVPSSMSSISDFSVTYSGYFIAPDTGSHCFYMAGSGDVKFYLAESDDLFLTQQYICGPNDSGGTKEWFHLDGDAPGYSFITSGSTSKNNVGFDAVASSSYQFKLEFRKTDPESGVVLLFTNNKRFREPLPVSAGVASRDGTFESSYTISGVSDVSLSEKHNAITQLHFSVPLVSSSSTEYGYYYDESNNQYVWNGDSSIRLKYHRLLKASFGYYVGGEEEVVQRFMGNISSFQVTRSANGNDMLVVTASDFLNLTKQTILINQPNKLAYWLAGYLGSSSVISPPAGDTKPTAFDRWHLEKAYRTICLLSGIDSTLVNKSRSENRLQQWNNWVV